ncbi:MAG: RNA 3'-terminal phosphate cyclase [Pseudomonadota bacterium]
MTITIDGAMGEGGGQVLRTALSLAAITGQAVQVDNIRAGRRRPGLMRQHLTALLALCDITDAQVDGAEVGSQRIRFQPGAIRAGDYAFSVGTAGSTGLVLQTVLPVLLHSTAPSTVRVSGGTHNPAAPPFEFLDRSYLPALRSLGYSLDASLLRHGFYPAGGGSVEVRVGGRTDVGTREFVRETRGEELGRYLDCLVANLASSIGERELNVAGKALDVPTQARQLQRADSDGPGNLLYARLEYQDLTVMFASFGERSVSAEQVANRLTKRVRAFTRSAAAVDHYLADQLLLPMALAQGGCFSTLRPSRHALTNAQVIERFLGGAIGFEDAGESCVCTVKRG